LDHVIALDERHLLRLMKEYVSYHHQDRVHDSLGFRCENLVLTEISSSKYEIGCPG
jgi:hypothetical protein